MGKFKIITALIVAGALLCAAGSLASDEKKEPEKSIIRVKSGSQKIVSVGKLEKVAIGDADVVKAEFVGEDQLLLTGAKPGLSTTMTVWLQNGTVSVYDVIVHSVSRDEVEGMLSALKTVGVREIGTKIIMYGEVSTAEDFQTCESITRRFPEVVNLVALRTTPTKVMAPAGEISSKIDNKNVKVSVVNDNIMLSGSVNTQKEFDDAEKVARVYGSKIINSIKIEKKQVEIDIIYASIDIAKASEYGGNLLQALNLQASIGRNSTEKVSNGGGGASGTGTRSNGGGGAGVGAVPLPEGNYAGVGASALSVLTFLKDKGAASILARPHLSVVSGEEAKLLSGGERGFSSVTTTGSTNVTFKEFGLIMKIKPEVDRDQKVSLFVSLELSLPVGAAGTNAELAFTKFETNSNVACSFGETIVLSGLIEALRNESRSKTPILGDIPILGLFFGKSKKEFRNQRLVILVTPQQPTVFKSEQKPASQDAREIVKQADENIVGADNKKPAKKSAPPAPPAKNNFTPKDTTSVAPPNKNEAPKTTSSPAAPVNREETPPVVIPSSSKSTPVSF